ARRRSSSGYREGRAMTRSFHEIESPFEPGRFILVTVLHLRKLATMDLLGELFGVTAMTISRAKQEVRPLLEAHGHHITASTARFRTPSDVATFLASKPA
ncbi:transposase family protein, partial [Streptomyces sp. NPDC006700]|uniref:transposase family protein n=1 Tax=Streptomyces sp. NPDC006700 TaxID=3154479 RepID=UPI0033EE6C8A